MYLLNNHDGLCVTGTETKGYGEVVCFIGTTHCFSDKTCCILFPLYLIIGTVEFASRTRTYNVAISNDWFLNTMQLFNGSRLQPKSLVTSIDVYWIMKQGTLQMITFEVFVIDIGVIKEIINNVSFCYPFGPFPYCLSFINWS